MSDNVHNGNFQIVKLRHIIESHSFNNKKRRRVVQRYVKNWNSSQRLTVFTMY